MRTTTLSCNLSFVHRFEGGIGLIAGLTVLFVATAVALAVRCRHTLVPGLFDTDSEYRTIYDASESTVSLNRVDASDGGGAADVGESSPTEDGLETDDDEPTTGAADSTLAAKRPLVARSVRGSATGSAKKRNKTVDA